MAKTPKYVRLAEHLTRGGRYDLNSGWGISGRDVKETPDEESEPRAFAFVVGELRAGRLEGASRAEFDEVHPDIAATLGFSTRRVVEEAPPTFQERQVQKEARRVNAKIRKRRATEADASAFEADEKRRKATLAAQKAQEARAEGGSTKSAAEAEEEAEAASRAHLEREAALRATGSAPVVAGANEPVEDDEDEGDDLYESMGKQALVDLAKRRGVAASGSADAIRDRLRAQDGEGDEDEDEPEDDDTDDDGDDDTEDDSDNEGDESDEDNEPNT